MQHCEKHKGVEAVGYCRGCGTFGCVACLPATDDQGRHYCPSCAERVGLAVPQEALRPGGVHHRHIVRYKDGRRLRGTFYAMDLTTDGFNFVALPSHASAGEPPDRVFVPFASVKAIFQVRDFHGDRHHPPRYLTPGQADPHEVAVYFSDGEVIRGRVSGQYGPHDKRFYLTPADPTDNNIQVLVEASAVDRVESHGQQGIRELHDLLDNPVRKRILLFYWANRGKTTTLAELARAIERVETVVADNLKPYIDHGLIERYSDSGREVLALRSPPDRATRELLKTYHDEIAHLYFRRKAAVQRPVGA